MVEGGEGQGRGREGGVGGCARVNITMAIILRAYREVEVGTWRSLGHRTPLDLRLLALRKPQLLLTYDRALRARSGRSGGPSSSKFHVATSVKFDGHPFI